MEILNEKSKELMLNGYTNENPFKFIVIDDFMNDVVINNIASEVQKLDTNNADYVFYDPKWENNKYAFSQNLGDYLTNVIKYLSSAGFITYIEKLTGIKNIIKDDMTLKGAGIHRIHNKGFLSAHTDFNTYHSSVHGRLDRRLNLLLYLNKDWKKEYNGSLLLCDRFTGEVKYDIMPIINRCVIFNTTKDSIHGHPDPLDIPEDVKRESLAIYYYTKNENGIDFEGDAERCTIIFNIDNFDRSNIKTL